MKEQFDRLSHFNFDDNRKSELKSFIDRQDDKSNVSSLSNVWIIISKHGVRKSVELIFKAVKLLNFNSKRRFVGIEFTGVVIGDA